MKWDDLLTVPYKANGRDMSGMDCYGLVLECCRRNGTPLRDVRYEGAEISADTLSFYTRKVNVRPIENAKAGAVIECEYEGNLHIGFLIDTKTVLHMTYEGMRVSPLLAFRHVRFYEVIKNESACV